MREERERKTRAWLLRHAGGSIGAYWFGHRVTLYGFNAMHVALQFWTRRWGWVVFHPPIHFLGWNWPWSFYVSPNGTPSAATFAAGPGVSAREKRQARLRLIVLGHNYPISDYDYEAILNIEESLAGRTVEEEVSDGR